MDTLEVGETTTLSAQFTDEDGDAVNPTTVRLTIVAPDGTTTVITSPHASLLNPSVGTWQYVLTATAAGLWSYRLEGTAGVLAGETRYLVVGSSAATDSGPCEDWCTAADVTECRSDLAADAVARMIPVASEIMFALSWKKFPGFCTATRSICVPCMAACVGHCTCGTTERVELGGNYPVAGVVRVTVEGINLDRSTYRVDDWRWLVRLDGNPWPRCPDLTDPTEFQVEWVYGRAVPVGGRHAAATLAGELAAACVPGTSCRLPARITGVTAEGITYTIVDPQAIIEKGATGITEVDLWLWSVTKGDVLQGGRSFDPGASGRVVATG